MKDHIVMEQEPLVEVPQAIEQRFEKRNYHITDTELGIGTPTEKYQNNITAILPFERNWKAKTVCNC